MPADICKIKKRKDPDIEEGYQGKIFVTKTINKNRDYERYYLKLLKTRLKKKDSIFFNPYIAMKTCLDGNNHYLMKKLDGDLIKLIFSDKKLDFKNILLQLLISVYILNHKMKLYHNDLFYEEKVRNIMYIKNKDKNIIYENNFIKIKVGEYIIKIIDFGQSRKYPAHLTKKTKDSKYFEKLELTSEVLLTMHYYFQSIYLANNYSYSEELKEKTLKLGKRLEKKSEYNLKIFDQLVIKYIKNNFNKYMEYLI